MAKYANAILAGTSMSSDGSVMIYTYTGQFFNTDENPVVTEQADIPVEVSPTALVATIEDAIVDAVVAHADSEYGWTVPRTRVVYTPIQRGLIV